MGSGLARMAGSSGWRRDERAFLFFIDCFRNSAIWFVFLVFREVAKTNSFFVFTKFFRSSCRRRERGFRIRDWGRERVGGYCGNEENGFDFGINGKRRVTSYGVVDGDFLEGRITSIGGV